MRLFLACLLFGLLLSLPISVEAATIAIPDDAETFQAALDRAEAGDTILVADGEYAGDANTQLIVDLPLVILSENGPDNCIINCAENNATFALELQATATVRGFTITGAVTGIRGIQSNDHFIADCIIQQGTQIGLHLDTCLDFLVQDCEFIEIVRNEAEQGAGMRLDASNGHIDNCSFTDNSTLGSGAGLYMNTCEVTLNNCVFTGNSATAYGGGMLITSNSTCSVQWSTFIGNNSEEQNGGAIGVTETSRLSMTESTLTQNTTPRSGGAIYLSNSPDYFISRSVFENNAASRYGGGILAYNNCVGEVSNCLFVGNQAGIDGGGIAATSGTSLNLLNCDVVGNIAGVDRDNGMGGGLYMGSNSLPTVRNSIFWANEADIGPQMFAQNAANVSVTYTCSQDGLGEDDWSAQEIVVESILEDDPQFEEGRDPEFALNGYFLNPDSPCIDFSEDTAEELGLDTYTTQADLTFDTDAADLGFHYHHRWFHIVGRLFGQVIDIANDEPLENVDIVTSLGQMARTDAEGNWEIEEAYAMVLFSITASTQGYNPLTFDDQMLEENEEIDINFELTHPEFVGPNRPVSGELDVGEEIDIPFTIGNAGNGPLTWSAVPTLTQDVDVAPLALRQSTDPIANLKGAVLVNGIYFLAISSDEENIIGLMTDAGEMIASFPQPGQGGGMTDLAWSGELLWGSRDNMVYGFTTDGAVMHSFEGPRNPTTSLAWDDQRDWLWACGINSPFIAYNVNGEQVGQAVNPGLRVYGLAFWRQAPLGSQLYVQSDQGNAPRQAVTSINPDNGNATFVGILNPNGEQRPSGLFISADPFPYGYTLLAIPANNNAGRIDFWNLDLKQGWLSVEPDAGNLDPDEEQELTLTLNSADFPEGAYEAELAFTHNAFGGRTILPVNMAVIAGPSQGRRAINLKRGWNLISANLQPDAADFPTLAAGLVEAGALRLVKDQEGRYYNPVWDFCNLEDWSVEQGYWFRMNFDAVLPLEGMTVRSDEPISLIRGWQTVAYYPRRPVSAATAFSRLEDNLVLVKDGAGNFYSADFGFDMIGVCREGSGYQVLVRDDAEFVWSLIPAGQVDTREIYVEIPEPRHFAATPSTGSDMSLLILTPETLQGECGVYADDVLVGSGVIVNGRCGVAVRGDNPITTEVEGAAMGAELRLEFRDGEHARKFEGFELIKGSLKYAVNGFTVLEATQVAAPREFGLAAVYPNPFNSMARIDFNLNKPGAVSLIAYDVMGREVRRLVDMPLAAGSHKIAFDAEGLASGIYILRLTSKAEGVQSVKVTCLH